MAALRSCPILLVLMVLATTSAANALQTPSEWSSTAGGIADAASPLQAEAPSSLAQIHHDPLAVLGTRVTVEGTVVRTTRRTDDAGAPLRFLLADRHGDTVSVQGATALPPIGARVIVNGIVELDNAGLPIIGPEGSSLVVTVLDAPGIPVAAVGEGGSAQGPGGDPTPCGQGQPGALRGLACAATEAASAPLLLAGGALLLLGAGFVLVRVRRRRMEQPEDSIALIVDLGREAREPKDPMPSVVLADLAPTTPDVVAHTHGALAKTNGSSVDVATRFDHGSVPQHNRIAVPRVVGPTVDERPSEAIREEDVVQLLPGRLEVLQGRDLDPEIRFFRVSSTEIPEITFGRASGPLYRHVQLPFPDVDPLHARLRYKNRCWTIANLSHTNPVVLNQRPLAPSEDGVALEDGDRIQMGDVAFRFRAAPR